MIARDRPLRLDDVCGLRTLLTLYDFELHAVAFGQGLEPVALDRAEVDEDVRTSLTGDEPKSLRVVEPLHSAVETCHETLPLLPLPGLTVTLEPCFLYIQSKRMPRNQKDLERKNPAEEETLGTGRLRGSRDMPCEATATGALEGDVRCGGRRRAHRISLDRAGARRTTQGRAAPVARNQVERLGRVICIRAGLTHPTSSRVHSL